MRIFLRPALTRALRLLPVWAILLAGCEQLGFEDPAKAAATKEAEGRALGGACRHSGRALEDCYALNPKQSKAAIYAGWRDMDAYMRENHIEVVAPELPHAATKKPQPAAAEPAPAAAGH